MKRYFAILFVALISLACGDLEETNVDLPNTVSLTKESIATDLPIIHLTVDSTLLDSMMRLPYYKIYTPASFSLHNNPNGNNISNERVTLRVKGAASVQYDVKSLEIIFEEEQNNAGIGFFELSDALRHQNLSTFNTIRIRNSGQDFTKTMIKDKSYSQLAHKASLNFELMHIGSPTQVFINNNYYGLLNIRTESNLAGLSKLMRTTPDKMVIYKVDADNGNIEFNEGNQALTVDLEAAIDRGSTAELSSLIDANSFIDYIIYQDYIGNTDWPHNNIRMYSIEGEPFRFILYDTDHAARKTKNPLLPELEYVSHDLAKIYRAFREIPGFDEQVENRQKELFNFFTPALFNQIVNENATLIKEDILYQISKHQQPQSPYQWKWHIDKMKRDFERRDHYIREKYHLD